MNKKQSERVAGVRDAMDERAAKQRTRTTSARPPNAVDARTAYDLQQEAIEWRQHLTAIIADGAETNAEITCTLRRQIDEQAERIEKLEAALRDTVHCLIGGSVDINAALPPRLDKFHEHRILGVGSVMTMAEIYRRLEK